MFKTAVDISMLSPRATIRWKRESFNESDQRLSKAEHRRVHSMVSSNNPSRFLNTALAPIDDSVRVSKHEDLKEISVQLGILRKKHDLNRDSNLIHDSDIARLKKKLEGFDLEEEKTKSKIAELKEVIEKLEFSTQEVKHKQEDALSATNAYKHILERMRISKMKLDIKNEDLISTLKSNSKILTEEIDINRRNKESKIKTKNALGTLEEFIDKETKEKCERLDVIEKDVKQKQENNQKREERFKRQLEIAESAANEDRDMRATQMRESLMTHRFWFLYLGKRLSRDMGKFSSTEEAFEKVRKIAGVNDASEMVTKFLTTELAYNDLKRTVDESTYRIEEAENKVKETELKISNMEKSKIQNNMIEILSKDAQAKLKTISNDKQRLMKLKGIYEKIRAWSVRNLLKFGRSEKDCRNLPEGLMEIKKSAISFLMNLKNTDLQERNDKIMKIRIKEIIASIASDELSKLRSDSIEDIDHIQVMRDLAQSTDLIDSKNRRKNVNFS